MTLYEFTHEVVKGSGRSNGDNNMISLLCEEMNHFKVILVLLFLTGGIKKVLNNFKWKYLFTTHCQGKISQNTYSIFTVCFSIVIYWLFRFNSEQLCRRSSYLIDSSLIYIASHIMPKCFRGIIVLCQF